MSADHLAMALLDETPEQFSLKECINAAMQRIASSPNEFSSDHIHVSRMRLRLYDLEREQGRNHRHGSKLE